MDPIGGNHESEATCTETETEAGGNAFGGGGQA